MLPLMPASARIVLTAAVRPTPSSALRTENVLRALRAGASGFLLKDSPPPRIVEAIKRVAGGDPILSPAVLRRLMDRATAQSGDHDRARDALSSLALMKLGLDNRTQVALLVHDADLI